MIFAGRPYKLISPSYSARGEMAALLANARSQEKFLNDVWLMREPVAPTSRGPWPMRHGEASEAVVQIKRVVR